MDMRERKGGDSERQKDRLKVSSDAMEVERAQFKILRKGGGLGKRNATKSWPVQASRREDARQEGKTDGSIP